MEWGCAELNNRPRAHQRSDATAGEVNGSAPKLRRLENSNLCDEAKEEAMQLRREPIIQPTG
jgi:hypothetical protein